MIRRMSAFIILLANIVILAHAAMPHYHGDNIIATAAHIFSIQHDEDDASEVPACHHDGAHDHGDSAGRCSINDTIAALACRQELSDSSEFSFDIFPISFPEYMLPDPRETFIANNYQVFEEPWIEDPDLAAVALLRAPPAII